MSKANTCGGAIAPVRSQPLLTSERAIVIFTTAQGANVTARERFFRKLQQQQNPQRIAALDGLTIVDIARFHQRMAALAQQVSQRFDGTGIEVVISTCYLHDPSTLDYSLNSGIYRYDIPASHLQNGERSVNIVSQQLLDGMEEGVMMLSLEIPGGAGSWEVSYLSLVPKDG